MSIIFTKLIYFPDTQILVYFSMIHSKNKEEKNDSYM